MPMHTHQFLRVYRRTFVCTYPPASLYVSTHLSKLMYLSIYLCIRGVCGSCLCIQSRSISVLISLCIGRETYVYLLLSVARDMYMNIFPIFSKVCVYIYTYICPSLFNKYSHMYLSHSITYTYIIIGIYRERDDFSM